MAAPEVIGSDELND